MGFEPATSSASWATVWSGQCKWLFLRLSVCCCSSVMLKTTPLLLLLAGEQPLRPFILKVSDDEMFLVEMRLFFFLPQAAVGQVSPKLLQFSGPSGLSHYDCPINFYGRTYRDVKVSPVKLEARLSSAGTAVTLWSVDQVSPTMSLDLAHKLNPQSLLELLAC